MNWDRFKPADLCADDERFGREAARYKEEGNGWGCFAPGAVIRWPDTSLKPMYFSYVDEGTLHLGPARAYNVQPMKGR